ncbi:hypothetical protein HZA45_01910 [Candidatus Peregrinibacteria bacterium]|nr:hypothetical protein [Candidatus Peregrinibacteria bacterium]
MQDFLIYLFWPNPANAYYDSPKAMALLIVCGVLILASFGISFWRRRTHDGILRKLSRSWSVAAFWFGLTGLVLVIARAEQIQFVSMRFLWVLWLLAAALYLAFQIRLFRARYYQVLPTVTKEDPMGKYLPKKK